MSDAPTPQKNTTTDRSIVEELQDSYLTYAMSVIMSRALPDARDGLKPSQRRILVAMNDLHLGPRTKPLKCAKIAGDTSGNYHPHGEAVIYPTLVRMAQDWSMRYTLVKGQGDVYKRQARLYAAAPNPQAPSATRRSRAASFFSSPFALSHFPAPNMADPRPGL